MVIQGHTTPESTVYWVGLSVKVLVNGNGVVCSKCDVRDCVHTQEVRQRLLEDAKKRYGRKWTR